MEAQDKAFPKGTVPGSGTVPQDTPSPALSYTRGGRGGLRRISLRNANLTTKMAIFTSIQC